MSSFRTRGIEIDPENPGLETPEIRELVRSHLKNPLAPVPDPRIEELVHYPLKKPELGGGLTPKGKEQATALDDKETLALSQQHREMSRLLILAPIKTAELYKRNILGGKLSQEEKTALKNGITTRNADKTTDNILTVTKNGRLLTSEIKELMANLYKALKHWGNENCSKILLVAAQLQVQEEARIQENGQKPSPLPS